MKERANIQSLFVATLLIVAGTLSPSNGVDDRSNKSPFEMITTMLMLVTVGLLIYFFWEFTSQIRKRK